MLAPVVPWDEVRSWFAIVLSTSAFILALLGYRRGEVHRRRALEEADLGRLEEYWHEMKAYVVAVNRQRADLCEPMRALQPYRTMDWSEYEVRFLDYPTRLWPLLPGEAAEQCSKVFASCNHACAATRVFEARLRGEADRELVRMAEEAAGRAIVDADAELARLGQMVMVARAQLRGVKVRTKRSSKRCSR